MANPHPSPAGFDWTRLESATKDDPLRVMFSACLIGQPTGWDAQSYDEPLAMRLAKLDCVSEIPFCPEDVSLGTPRPLTTLHGGHGHDVLAGRARVVETTGRDVTAELLTGSHAMLKWATQQEVELAILMDVSDACGSHAIYIGDPKERRYQQGPGLAAAMLMNAGIPVLAQRDYATLNRLVAALAPTYEPDPEAIDFVDHPWFVDYFKGGPVGLKLADYESAKKSAGEQGASS